MTRGSLRFSEAEYKAYAAKAGFKVGTIHRPPAPDSPAIPPLAPGSGGAPNKYRNKPTDGYASIRESKRAFQLKLMQEAGQIRNLREQVSFLLIPKQEGERACSYVADFVYDEPFLASTERRVPSGVGDWQTVCEDCKGMRTDVYKIKRKLMLFVHKIRIRET